MECLTHVWPTNPKQSTTDFLCTGLLMKLWTCLLRWPSYHFEVMPSFSFWKVGPVHVIAVLHEFRKFVSMISARPVLNIWVCAVGAYWYKTPIIFNVWFTYLLIFMNLESECTGGRNLIWSLLNLYMGFLFKLSCRKKVKRIIHLRSLSFLLTAFSFWD